MRYMTQGQLLKRLRELIAERGDQRKTASFLGISETYLSDVLAGRRSPGKKVLTKLGLEPSTVYVERVA